MIRKLSKFEKLNEDVLNSKKWDKDAILNRCKNLTKVAMEIYQYPKPEKEINFDLNEFEFNLNEQWGNLNQTTVERYIFNGKTCYPENYNDMLDDILIKLNEMKPDKMKCLTKNDYCFKNNKTICLSLKKNKINPNKKIPKTNIYYCSNCKPTDIVLFIKKLYEQFELDKDSFILSCVE